MSINGQATYGRARHTVSLSRMPKPNPQYIVNFESLTGGLNLYDPDYRLRLNESPRMENMLWKDGVLCSRFGQSSVLDGDEASGLGYAVYERDFWGRAFWHHGSAIYYCDIDTSPDSMTRDNGFSLSSMYADYSPARGTFFRYGDNLYYKAPGVFVGIEYDAENDTFSAFDVASNAYTPITYMNADYRTGSGDAYQPENRLSAKKTILYNAGESSDSAQFTGDGSATSFSLSSVENFVGVSAVTLNGAATAGWYLDGSDLKFYVAPDSGVVIDVTCRTAVNDYKLPVSGDGLSVVSVKVDGAAVPGTGYSLNASTGVVHFSAAPTVHNPVVSNTVEITYSLANPDAFNSVMDCPYAIVYGGDQRICAVVGGCRKQPNAFFWNGNNIAMDISYWPMEHYNLGGDTEEEITGFCRQQGYLIVLKNKSIGRCSLSFTSINVSQAGTPRVFISMDYTSINSKIGCDLPWSIQLVDNNVVFSNTENGAHILLDSSAAYENNVECVSKKVNGSEARDGLLNLLRHRGTVVSHDDGKRYWLCADGKVFCWDYELSKYKDPSWFYLTGIRAVAFMNDNDRLFSLDADGRLSTFNGSYADYGEPFKRVYQFATQFFGSYDRLKDVVTAIFSIRSDTDTNIKINYTTDWESRDDLTPIVSRSWHLVPRSLARRSLDPMKFANVARRRPGCRHVKHFALTLTCDEVGYDMPILSAQVYYRFEGRDR